jgi:steroid delta-isomerase-like uncharacterized protein
MSEGNLRRMRAFFALANNHEVDGVAGLVHPDYRAESDTLPGPIEGREMYRSLLAGFWTAFPDASYEVEQMFAIEDHVITLFRLSGSHLGDFMGIPGSGKKFSVRVCHVEQWENGRIAAARYYWDSATLLRQLGIAAPVAAA